MTRVGKGQSIIELLDASDNDDPGPKWSEVAKIAKRLVYDAQQYHKGTRSKLVAVFLLNWSLG